MCDARSRGAISWRPRRGPWRRRSAWPTPARRAEPLGEQRHPQLLHRPHDVQSRRGPGGGAAAACLEEVREFAPRRRAPHPSASGRGAGPARPCRGARPSRAATRPCAAAGVADLGHEPRPHQGRSSCRRRSSASSAAAGVVQPLQAQRHLAGGVEDRHQRLDDLEHAGHRLLPDRDEGLLELRRRAHRGARLCATTESTAAASASSSRAGTEPCGLCPSESFCWLVRSASRRFQGGVVLSRMSRRIPRRVSRSASERVASTRTSTASPVSTSAGNPCTRRGPTSREKVSGSGSRSCGLRSPVRSTPDAAAAIVVRTCPANCCCSVRQVLALAEHLDAASPRTIWAAAPPHSCRSACPRHRPLTP